MGQHDAVSGDVRRPTAVVLYRWESDEHRARVFEFANRLRRDGIDADLDQFYTVPRQGWHDWGHERIKDSDFVIIICTNGYRRAFENEEDLGQGYGVVWEARLIKTRISEHRDRDENDRPNANQKYVVVLFHSSNRDDVPGALGPCGRWFVDLNGQYEGMLGHLWGTPPGAKAELGARPPLSQFQAASRHVTARSRRSRSRITSDILFVLIVVIAILLVGVPMWPVFRGNAHDAVAQPMKGNAEPPDLGTEEPSRNEYNVAEELIRTYSATLSVGVVDKKPTEKITDIEHLKEAFQKRGACIWGVILDTRAVDDDVFAKLCKEQLVVLPHLSLLWLSGTSVGDGTVERIANELPRIKDLSLTRTRVTNASAGALERMKRLEKLWIDDSQMPDLRQRLPNCKINPPSTRPKKKSDDT